MTSSFTEDTSISLPGIGYSSVAWSDYNTDGKPDFLLTGYSSLGYISKLYKNTGSGFSEDTSISLPGVFWSSVAWSDYTGEGIPDFLLTGWTGSGPISKLYKNTSDTTPPTASSFTPTDNATGVAVDANLVVNFSEDIQKGSGDIVLKTVSNKVVETIQVTADNITVSESQLTINPSNDLDPNKKYYVEIAKGAIKDLAGNDYAGITGDSTWNFQTQHRDGNDSPSGNAADDILTGGLGSDQFVDNTNAALANPAVAIDTITDFNTSQNNQIVSDKSSMTSMSSMAGTGFSVVSEFAQVTTDALAATSANDLVYNSTIGGLFYNQNGTVAGFGNGGQFLTLTGQPGLTASQFLIQA